MIRSVYLSAAIILGLLSCNSKSQEETVQFNVDKNLLAAEYDIDSLYFAFAPPKGWLADTIAHLNKETQRFSTKELDTYYLNIMEIFHDSSSNSFCSVSLIQSSDSFDKDHFLENFSTLVSKQFSAEDIKKGLFWVGELQITQYLVMTNAIVIFKLFFQTTNNNMLQIDYAIDRKIYANYIKKIESSIGSISSH